MVELSDTCRFAALAPTVVSTGLDEAIQGATLLLFDLF